MSEPTDLVTPPADVTVAEGTKRGTATTRVPTRVQTAIARRMAEVRATVPTWTASVDVDVQDLTSQLTGGAVLLDAVAKAVGVSLRTHERLNGAWRDGGLETWTQANLALAVDLAGESIVLPTILDAGGQSIEGIAVRRAELQAKAREGSLRAPDSAGPTFALIDGGPDGADRFDAIMPPGIGAALAIGAPRRRPWVVGEEVLPRLVVTLTLTADHRAIYPSHGGSFLRSVADLLEEPSGILGAA
ncbi:2-oxo acid dehydrogenase subunit E2 [Patulibacter sp.]|uniref:2-oxo acid dehydrogenase subunit E2 n=1 Tax=Patulibacter sp. TaxID=1912859 RepID=UPI00271D57D3|nr:2-oxo acid dehydrogenase subunit E2 [Patulibacter sp.]MDO9407607.1 2-oxo acid dehydrogenase subunit E2 [Patulibacter sp.]